MNLNSMNLNRCDIIAMGLNSSGLGISGHFLFNGTNLALKIDLSLFIVLSFHRLFNRYNYVSRSISGLNRKSRLRF